MENPAADLPQTYQEGGADGRFIYRVLLNEAKVPVDTVAMIPMEIKKKKAGLQVWQLFHGRVHTRSNEASLKVMRFVTKPPPVEPTQKGMLATVYQHWRQGVAQLAAKQQPVCELLQQDGLRALISHLPEVVKKWDNLDGADDGSEVSLTAYKALVQRMAEQYSSVANISQAYGAVTVLELAQVDKSRWRRVGRRERSRIRPPTRSHASGGRAGPAGEERSAGFSTLENQV